MEINVVSGQIADSYLHRLKIGKNISCQSLDRLIGKSLLRHKGWRLDQICDICGYWCLASPLLSHVQVATPADVEYLWTTYKQVSDMKVDRVHLCPSLITIGRYRRLWSRLRSFFLPCIPGWCPLPSCSSRYAVPLVIVYACYCVENWRMACHMPGEAGVLTWRGQSSCKTLHYYSKGNINYSLELDSTMLRWDTM